ncbi:hypothetical protein GGI12_005724 [Dipsacomyces acuminosporus]|nr:hypothetical protein GGI12_005724 [Dipsacomyces acuminosporus]
MDITSEFRKLVRQKTSEKEGRVGKDEKDSSRFDILPPKRFNFAQPAGNAYLTEAYIIAKHLDALRTRIIHIRPAYLNLQTKQGRSAQIMPPSGHGAGKSSENGTSLRHRFGMAKLTDIERDEIDQSIKAAIRQMLAKIRSLNELGESLLDSIGEGDENSMESAKVLFKRFVSALDPRQAGKQSNGDGGLQGIPLDISKRDVIAAHQSSVVWWLNWKLQRANKAHAEMEELYLRQKLERQKGAVAHQRQQRNSSSGQSNTHTKDAGSSTPADAASNQMSDDKVLSSLSEQELQQLQMENNSMMQEFESALDKIKETQRSLLEISTMQSQLANELNAQAQMTERLYNEAVGAVDAVGQGNDHLISARKNQAAARKWVLVIFIVLSFVLLFLDWFD